MFAALGRQWHHCLGPTTGRFSLGQPKQTLMLRKRRMTIDFGKVERYIQNRGFGFVSHTFAKGSPKEVFVHIKVVKRTDPELAQGLDNAATREQLYFWYEYSTSSKGQEVVAILNLQQIRHKYADQIDAFVATIKENWANVETHLSESLKRATFDLLAPDEADELAKRREALRAEQKARQNELRRAEAARLQEIADQMAAQQRAEAARRKAIADQRGTEKTTEEHEFCQLVAEMAVLGLTRSSQVSAYIVRHRLGYKYRHISGILQMELDGRVWSFDGGFPPKIYARLCQELGLGNNGSRALPREFTPYKDILDH
jgi:cold shock CspA family protein